MEKMTPNRSPLVVVVGSLNMDLVLRVPRAPASGETVFGQKLTFEPGGKGGNQAIACARLGGRVAMIGRVGNDHFGVQLREGLRSDGIDVAHVDCEATTTTGTALILVDDSAENRIVVIPGANGELTPEGMMPASKLIDQARLLLLQLEIPMLAVSWAVERAVAAGVTVILNPAPVRSLPEGIWSRIDYVIPNEVEASTLTGIDVVDVSSATLAARALRRRGARHVLITRGSEGVLIHDDRGTRSYQAPRVHAVDTTAAGDTFIGGLAAALTDGKELDVAAQFAVEAASLSVMRQGAQSSIPYREEVAPRLERTIS